MRLEKLFDPVRDTNLRAIDASHQLLEALSLCAGDLASPPFVILLSLLREERFDVGMLGQKGFSLVAPGGGELIERMLDLERLRDCRLGHRLCLSSECALVNRLSL